MFYYLILNKKYIFKLSDKFEVDIYFDKILHSFYFFYKLND